MSNIPFSAIGAALTPVQRSNNELLRARKVQLEKDSHHTEDVEELDETAVNAVNEQGGGGGEQKGREDRREEEEEERVEIAALAELPAKGGEAGRGRSERPQLDISA